MYPESTILMVRGEFDNSESIARMLSDEYRVLEAESAEDALTHASDGVDLVITELESSDFAGLELLRMWKAREPRTPFLVVTNGGDVNAAVEAMKLGAADCVVKPVNPGELRALVSRLVISAGTHIEDRSGGDSEMGAGHKSSIDIPPGTSLEDLERAAVEQALAQHHGNRTQAAKTLGISVRTLQRKLKAWGIPVLALHNSSPSNFLLPSHAGHTFSSHAH